MQITDNALSPIEFKKILNYFTSEAPDWKFVTNVTHGSVTEHGRDKWGFACSIYDCGNGIGRNSTEKIIDRTALKIIEPIIIDKNKLLRVRVGMIINVGPDEPHNPHIDQHGIEHLTQIYYLTASDALTNVFEEYGLDEKYKTYKPEDFTIKMQSKPEPNRMLVFDGFHWHSSSHVYGPEVRISVNINYAK
jgi:hypothetical protein|tara:strand:- start:176 stop:748 length:573 start_codon:yes stop_codon:yes gene_type:complete